MPEISTVAPEVRAAINAVSQTELTTASTNDRARANHTGTQAQSTITNLTTDLAAKVTLPVGGSTGQPLVKASAGGVEWGVVTGPVLTWRYTAGAWPTLPTTQPAGVQQVTAIGPTQPTTVPSWIGLGPTQVPCLYTYANVT